jgi:hypothetical protein
MQKKIELIIKSKKVIDFYEKNPEIDFESVNLIIVDLYEKLLYSVTENTEKLRSTQLLKELDKFKSYLNVSNSNLYNDILLIKDTSNIMNDDITNKIIIKIFEIIQLYTNDLKIILDNPENIDINKIVDKIKKKNIIIINNLSSIINEKVPNNYNNIILKYDNIIADFEQDLDTNMNNIKINNSPFEKINELIDEKFTSLLNNIEKMIYISIPTDEERPLKRNIIYNLDYTINTHIDDMKLF